jgi:hypothetical protein
MSTKVALRLLLDSFGRADREVSPVTSQAGPHKVTIPSRIENSPGQRASPATVHTEHDLCC